MTDTHLRLSTVLSFEACAAMQVWAYFAVILSVFGELSVGKILLYSSRTKVVERIAKRDLTSCKRYRGKILCFQVLRQQCVVIYARLPCNSVTELCPEFDLLSFIYDECHKTTIVANVSFSCFCSNGNT